ncbi:DUF6194 family protein [Jannaschia sp. R86511]|uniref:DUF6194 family protein n=1 Tax=Jannaschia sp. R86511 TaxID=3093853 RepID=UPI0036D2AA28
MTQPEDGTGRDDEPTQPQVDDVLAWVRALTGVVVTTAREGDGSPPSAWGDSFVSHDPDGSADQGRWQPFATVVTSDYPGFDTASRLDRPGVYRVNVAAGRELFAELLGYPPAAAEAHQDEVDHAAADVWLPHPVYAAQGWVCVVRPGPVTTPRLRRLLEQAHARAAARYREA